MKTLFVYGMACIIFTALFSLTGCFGSSKKEAVVKSKTVSPIVYSEVVKNPESLKKLIEKNKGLYQKLVSGEVNKAQYLVLCQNFLKENKDREGVIEHEKGYQYEIILDQNGAKPTLNSNVRVNYKVYLIDGEVLQNTFEMAPIKVNNMDMILGWKEALPTMSVGSVYRFYFPPDLGYGENSDGRIPANAVLIYEVELLEILGN